MKILTDGEMQTHMIIRGEFHSKESTVTRGGMIRVEHLREISGIVKVWLIALLMDKWNQNTTMVIITMEIGVILIVKGIILHAM